MNSPSARESAPGGRFFLFAILSVVLMYFDQKDGWGDRIRYGLQAVAYPIQVTVGSPRRLWDASAEMFRTRASLREENEALQQRDRELSLRTQRYEALEAENAQLRGLQGALPELASKSVLVDVVNADLGRLRQRLVVNKGDGAGLFRSQVVMDTNGVVGQLVRVGPWSAEVMLITDPSAAIPVQVVRSGERSIAVGTGNSAELQMPYLPVTADVKAGDLVVTSGLGGVYPAGIAVGKVIESRREPDALLLSVRVAPAAQLDRSRQLMALWFNPGNPAAPTPRELLDNLPEAPVADPVVQAAPRRPAAAAPAPAPAPATPTAARPGVGPRNTVPRPAPRPAATPDPAPPAESTPAVSTPAESAPANEPAAPTERIPATPAEVPQ